MGIADGRNRDVTRAARACRYSHMDTPNAEAGGSGKNCHQAFVVRYSRCCERFDGVWESRRSTA